MTARSLLASLRQVVAEYTATRDPAVVLAMEPLDLAARLVEAAEPGSQIYGDALAAVGLLHWYRALLLPAPDDEPDLDRALELFSQLSPEHRDLVPQPIRRLLHREREDSGYEPDISRRLELCDDLLTEYRESQDPEVLLTALALLDQVQGTLPDGDPAITARQAQFAVAQYEQYRRIGDTSALDHAIDLARASARHTHPGDPATIARMSNLSLMLRDRYDRRARVADLDEATEVGRAAAELAAEKGALPPAVAANLGMIRLSQFRHYRRLTSLDEAVGLMDAAAAASDHLRGRYLSNLAVTLRTRYDATGSHEDLRRAVDAARAAVEATAPDDPDRSRFLSNLASVYRAHYEVTGDIGDIDAAVDAARAAVAGTAPDGPDRGRFLSNLALALRTRHDAGIRDVDSPNAPVDSGQDSRSVDLAEAIEVAWAAVDHTAADHPDRADRLTTLAATLLQTERGTDRAVPLLREAARNTVGRPAARVTAAQIWAHSAAGRGDFADALAGFTTAISLLPLLVSREVADRDQAFRLSGVLPGLTADAVATALSCGDLPLAVELWEQGHGILLDQILQLRADSSHLAAANPALAKRLMDIASALNAPAHETPFSQESPLTALIDRRIRLSREWDELVEQIRHLPGFEDFLRPPRTDDLLAAAADGPVVLINVSQYRSDALLVTHDGVRSIRLPNVTPELVQAMARDFLGAFGVGHRSTRASQPPSERLRPDPMWSTRERLLEILHWLWAAIAEPVLAELGLAELGLAELGLADGVGDGERARLWWCPAGDLVLLPLHAAGHRYAPQQSVPDLVVSSYTPTLRTLLHAQANPAVTLAGARMLAVGMPFTPGAYPLPHVVREIQAVTERFPENTISLIGETATRASVLDAMARTDIVHVACHGRTDLADPSASGLMLANGDLTVADVLKQGLGTKELAVLSACRTAVGGAVVSDEPVHLASALQLAGYRHVIGTLWPVLDDVAAETVEHFYVALDGFGKDPRHIARALSDALRRMRENNPDKPDLWFPFVHFGP